MNDQEIKEAAQERFDRIQEYGMRNKIAYVLATILCFSGCTSTSVTPVSPSKLPEELSTHTYLDEFPFDPYRSVGSVNFADGVLIGSGVLIAPNLILTAAHVAERSEDLMFVEYDGDTHYVSQIIYYLHFQLYLNKLIYNFLKFFLILKI